MVPNYMYNGSKLYAYFEPTMKTILNTSID